MHILPKAMEKLGQPDERKLNRQERKKLKQSLIREAGSFPENQKCAVQRSEMYME